MIGKPLISIALFLLPAMLKGALVQDTVYINAGFFKDVQSDIFSKAFNATPLFSTENTTLLIKAGDVLQLRVINTDTVSHTINWGDLTTLPTPVPPGSSELVELAPSVTGYHRYFDADAQERYLGLSGLIIVQPSFNNTFWWNLKEFSTDWNKGLLEGKPLPTGHYRPDIFQINGKGFSLVHHDTTAVLTARVHDTITIVILNSGEMFHSIHFHGYHARIKMSTTFPAHKDRVKDTFPVYQGALLVLELIPHQPGKYPVHDHNLLATTTGGNSPGGMITMLNILP